MPIDRLYTSKMGGMGNIMVVNFRKLSSNLHLRQVKVVFGRDPITAFYTEQNEKVQT